MNSNNNNMNINNPATASLDIRTANSDVDFPTLFRGLSSFELTGPAELAEFFRDTNGIGGAHMAERSIDLTEILLREQSLVSAGNANLNNSGGGGGNSNSSSSALPEQQLAMLHTMTKKLVSPLPSPQQPFHETLSGAATNSMMCESSSSSSSSSSCSDNTFDSVSPKPHTIILRSTSRNNANVKRLVSSAMPTASPTSPVIRKTTRGRRPISLKTTAADTTDAEAAATTTATTASKKKLTKKELMLKTISEPVVCFGNKVVIKDTEEYNIRRKNNNDAVKKCRQNLNEKQRVREERLKQLDDENRRLSSTVESLQKEMNVLRNIIVSMSPHKKLPDYIQDMISKLDKPS